MLNVDTILWITDQPKYVNFNMIYFKDLQIIG